LEKVKGFSANDPRYLGFIELFNQHKFFEAHEILEVLWKEIEGPDLDFLKGLIQIAAAFVHVQKGRFDGAHQLFKTASGYLQKYPSPYKNIGTQNLLSAVEESLISGKGFPKIKLKTTLC